MAKIINRNLHDSQYLKAFHCFGRLESAVDTLIVKRSISRMHAIIEWIEGKWVIRDISKNGIWLNNNKLSVNQNYPLSVDDIICLSKIDEIYYSVAELLPPQDMLLPIEDSTQTSQTPISLTHYNFFPDESTPELIIYYDAKWQCWYREHIQTSDNDEPDNDELVCFSQTNWQLLRLTEKLEDRTAIADTCNGESILLVFHLSQDEEHTELYVKIGQQILNLDVRIHHY